MTFSLSLIFPFDHEIFIHFIFQCKFLPEFSSCACYTVPEFMNSKRIGVSIQHYRAAIGDFNNYRINCNVNMMNSRAYSYLDNIIVFEEIKNMILVFFLFIMTYLIPLLLGCYLECGHLHIIRHIPLPRMYFYPKLLAFTLYTKFLFYMLIPLPNLRNKNFRPLKVLSLFIPSFFSFIKLLTAFFDLIFSKHNLYVRECSDNNTHMHTVEP